MSVKLPWLVTRSARVEEKLSTQQRDGMYERLGEELAADAHVPAGLRRLAEDPRVTVRRAVLRSAGGALCTECSERSVGVMQSLAR